MFAWEPVARPDYYVGVKLGHPHQLSTFVCSKALSFLLGRRVSFPMGAYGAPTLKYTVFLGQMFGGAVLLT